MLRAPGFFRLQTSGLRLPGAALAGGIGLVLALAPTGQPAYASDGTRARCPREMALSGGTCVDRWEAHLAKRNDDGSLTPFAPYTRPTGGTFVAESSAGMRPQAYISRTEAASACENAGKRLCTVTEWYRACRGPQDTLYPYGATYVSGRCNVGKPHLLSILHGSNPRAWSYDAAFNDPELDKKPGFLAEAGEYTGCVTSAGIFDLVGNLHEWVSDRVDTSIVEKLPLTPGIKMRVQRNAGKGVFMGGFFSTTNQHGDGCAFVTMAHEPAYHDYSTGFRCCKDPSG